MNSQQGLRQTWGGVWACALLACGGVFAAASTAAAQCAPGGGWSAPFEGAAGQPALDNTVIALGTWDQDGDGPLPPRLIVGGTFGAAGGVATSRVAMWNGAWRAMGTGVTSSGFPSVAIGWDPDGSGPLLPQAVFGGFYTTMGGVTVRNVAHWDGAAWGPFGAGTQDISGLPDVYAAVMWDPDGAGPAAAQLVIGGDFTVAGGASRKRIARWDGAAWQGFGTGMSDSVYALTTWDPDGDGPLSPQIVAAGFFGLAGTTSANRIARWDGAAWQALGAGLDGTVEAVASWDPDGPGPALPVLVAGGTFLTSGGATVNRIARWDGSAWQPMGAGFDDNRVFTLTTFDFDGAGPQPARMVAGGSFTTSGGAGVGRVAYFDGAAWKAMGSGMNNSVFELTTWDADGAGPQAAALVAAGSFTSAGGVTASRIALWSATNTCRGDFDCSGTLAVADIFAFLSAWFEGNASADFNGVGGITVQDIFDFLGSWFAGCP